MLSLINIINTDNEPKIIEEIMQGGKRKGSGRKPAPYKTVTIAFRVREEWAKTIKRLVKDKVTELSQNSS
jgi:hypothetical protein